MQKSKLRGTLIVILVYVVALAAGYFSVVPLEQYDPLWKAAIADIVATVVVYLASTLTRNASLYDPYWSVIPMALVFYWCAELGTEQLTLTDWLIFFGVFAWGIRLTMNWWTGWPGMHHQDWRYLDLKKKSGPLYWLVNLTGIHLFPTLLVFLGCLPLYALIADDGGSVSTLLMWVAVIVTIGAVLLEGIADWQRRTRYKQPEGVVYRSGLWAISRHPNYLGEVLFWLGLFIAALAHGSAYYWTGIGALSMFLLFVFISIPMMEKRQMHKEGYAEYIKEVPAFLPWLKF